MINGKQEILLETIRLKLRPISINDAKEAFNNWCKDPEVSKYMRWETHKTIEDTKEWLTFEEKIIKEEMSQYTWGIILKESEELIGTIGAYLRKNEDNRYEIGYNIGKKYWRNGYTTEALKCVMEYLIKQANIKKFICKHAIDNPASGAVMKKVEFKYVQDEFYKKDNTAVKYKAKVYYLDIDK